MDNKIKHSTNIAITTSQLIELSMAINSGVLVPFLINKLYNTSGVYSKKIDVIAVVNSTIASDILIT